ncbi:MAG: hypothetical protein HC804_07015 [Anaerolineae bacterium]|nr:hypothetical protein [Anaerolineae bacterium]
MKSKLTWIIAAIVIVLLLIYFGGSWFFGDLLISRETSTLTESEASMSELGLPTLPSPEAVTIQNGDIALAGFYYDNEKDGDCAVLFTARIWWYTLQCAAIRPLVLGARV